MCKSCDKTVNEKDVGLSIYEENRQENNANNIFKQKSNDTGKICIACSKNMKTSNARKYDYANNNTTDNRNLCETTLKHASASLQTSGIDNPHAGIQSNGEIKSRETIPETISVNRSYARGNATFSVAKRRSSSPFSEPRKLTAIYGSCNCPQRCRNETCDITTLQNLNNERLLREMRLRAQWCLPVLNEISTFFKIANINDHCWEIFLLLSASTFLALCIGIKPMVYVLTIVLFLIFRLLVLYVLTK